MRKYLLNKYLLTLLVFAVILTFCGEQSLVQRVRRSHEISQKEEELQMYQRQIKETNAQIDRLNESVENLEQFAREEYFMHSDKEDVFIINER